MSPPCNLPTIPGVTEPEEKAASEERSPAPSGDAAAQKPKENIAPSEVKSKLRSIMSDDGSTPIYLNSLYNVSRRLCRRETLHVGYMNPGLLLS